MPYIHESGLIGIGFSLFVVVVAALNLVLDFDFIEQGAAQGVPKYMEWYGGLRPDRHARMALSRDPAAAFEDAGATVRRGDER